MEPRPRAKIGIVVPCYNSAKYLASTLESIAGQTFTDWLCVIVDDASKDNTVEIADTFIARDHRFELIGIPWAGVSVVRNSGFEHLRGRCEYVIFLDSDDHWYPHSLETLYQLLKQHPDAPAALGTADFMDADEKPMDRSLLDAHVHRRQRLEGTRIVDVPPEAPTTWQMLATWPSVLTPGLVLLRAEAFDRSGGYDPELRLAEDYELWYRVALQGELVQTLTPVLRHRKHGTSLSRSKKRRSEMAKARRKIIANPRNSAEQYRYNKAARRAVYRTLAKERVGQGLSSLKSMRLKDAARQIATGLGNVWMSIKPA